MSIIEPRNVAEAVEGYVASELLQAVNAINREALDESGIWSLHRLAADIYELGWAPGRCRRIGTRAP